MIKSELILPIRFYDDLFNQYRFGNMSEPICEPLLVYPSRQLPHFQIKRTSSLLPPTQFKLRNICVDKDNNYYKVIPEGASNFHSPDAVTYFDGWPEGSYTYDNGVDPPESRVVVIAETNCNILKSVVLDPDYYTVNGQPSNMTVQVPVCLQRFKLTVDKFKGNFEIRIKDNTLVQAIITAPGAYTFDFVATSTFITIQFYNFDATTDYFELSHIQSQVLDLFCFTEDLRDVNLDETELKVIPLENGNDLIIYCNESNNYIIPPGDYYYFVKCVDSRASNAEFYISEVFTVKSVKDIENFYRLKWYNSCDIENRVIYNAETLECNYYNTAFLPASLFKPQYPTVQELIEDGAGNKTAVFKKWEKTKTLEVVSPEFLTDALSAIFLHDRIFLLEPINKKEEFQPSEFLIKQIEQEVNDVLNESHQKILLTLLLEDNVTGLNCCLNSSEYGRGYKYEAYEDCEDDHEFKLALSETPTLGDGLIKCEDDSLVKVLITDIIKYTGDSKFYRLKLEGGIYQTYRVMPIINTIVNHTDELTGELQYKIDGYILPNSFALPEYNADAHGWTDTNLTFKSDSEGVFTAYVPRSISVGASDLDIRVKNISKENDFGYSNIIDVV